MPRGSTTTPLPDMGRNDPPLFVVHKMLTSAGRVCPLSSSKENLGVTVAVFPGASIEGEGTKSGSAVASSTLSARNGLTLYVSRSAFNFARVSVPTKPVPLASPAGRSTSVKYLF